LKPSYRTGRPARHKFSFQPRCCKRREHRLHLGGTGWYRKTFVLPSKKNKKIYLEFDGVYMNANVWLNGKHLGNHPYGYTSFYYDISKELNGMKKIFSLSA
jgi:beta-galactosidase